jgi:hypothetical protein
MNRLAIIAKLKPDAERRAGELIAPWLAIRHPSAPSSLGCSGGNPRDPR